GFKIHCTCKRLFFARVRKFKIGEWRLLENFSLHPATGKYRETRQVQITNAFETSSVVINPDGFDVQDYLRLPTNELALSTVTREVVKPKGKKRQIDRWSFYPEKSVLDIIMATEVSLISIESEDNTCLTSTPLSKRRVDSDLDDHSSTSKKKCFKIIKVEKNNGDFVIITHSSVFLFDVVCFDKYNNFNPNHSQRSLMQKGMSYLNLFLLSTVLKKKILTVGRTCVKSFYYAATSSRATGSNASQVTFQNKHTPNQTFSEPVTRDTTRNQETSQKVVTEHELPNDNQENEAFQDTMDEFSDLEFECSSQEQCDTDTSDDEQPSIDLEPVKDHQSDRVTFLAALFKKNFSQPKAKVKPVSPKKMYYRKLVIYFANTVKHT
ncbi:hypothetical protein HID58_003223, partial [Brassica napus]